jgi:beta-mannosidase
MAIRTAVEHWRRLKPHCMGTLFWQLNDLWPVASWSSIDYYGRWKVLQHEAKRFYAPFLVSLERREKSLAVWATSDLPTALDLKGRLESVTWAGKLVSQIGIKGRLKPGESRLLAEVPFSRLLKEGKHPREVLCFARLGEGGVQADNFAPLVPWKWVPVVKPLIHNRLRLGNKGLELQVVSRNIVPFFHAEFRGWEGHFTGDWKVLKPGEENTFNWVPHFKEKGGARSLAEAKKRLRTLSFYDLFDHH